MVNNLISNWETKCRGNYLDIKDVADHTKWERNYFVLDNIEIKTNTTYPCMYVNGMIGRTR